jgi:hypothetical protein
MVNYSNSIIPIGCRSKAKSPKFKFKWSLDLLSSFQAFFKIKKGKYLILSLKLHFYTM